MPGRNGFDFNGASQSFNVLASYLFGKVLESIYLYCFIDFRNAFSLQFIECILHSVYNYIYLILLLSFRTLAMNRWK